MPQLIGVWSAAMSATILAAFLVQSYGQDNFDFSAGIVFSGLILAALAAGWAASKDRPFLLIIFFIVSFLPLGLYLSMVPSWVRYAGMLQLGYLLSAGLMYAERRARKHP